MLGQAGFSNEALLSEKAEDVKSTPRLLAAGVEGVSGAWPEAHDVSSSGSMSLALDESAADGSRPSRDAVEGRSKGEFAEMAPGE